MYTCKLWFSLLSCSMSLYASLSWSSKSNILDISWLAACGIADVPLNFYNESMWDCKPINLKPFNLTLDPEFVSLNLGLQVQAASLRILDIEIPLLQLFAFINEHLLQIHVSLPLHLHLSRPDLTLPLLLLNLSAQPLPLALNLGHVPVEFLSVCFHGVAQVSVLGHFILDCVFFVLSGS